MSARWSPKPLDGIVGFYYRRFADKLPQTLLTPALQRRHPNSNLPRNDLRDLFRYLCELGKPKP